MEARTMTWAGLRLGVGMCRYYERQNRPVDPEQDAYLVEMGFSPRGKEVAGRYRKVTESDDGRPTVYFYVSRYVHRNGKEVWTAKRYEDLQTWEGPASDSAITALVHAQVEDWGRG